MAPTVTNGIHCQWVYPRTMAGKPAEPPRPGWTEQAEPVEHERTHASERPHERIGPVNIERLRKDDGRALILYSSIDPANGA